MYNPGGLTLTLVIHLEMDLVEFPVTAVCSNVKNLSLMLQPGLSRTETALILLMTIPLPLHAVSRVWPWPLAVCHALSAAECFQIRYKTLCSQFEDAPNVHTANGLCI